MKKKVIRVSMAIAALVFLGFGVLFGLQQLRASSKAIPTTRVQKGTLELDINTPGELHTPHSTMLVAPSVNGALQIVRLAKTGAPVKAGDVVVEFDPSEQQYNLEQSRSQLAEAEQQIVKARADAAVKTAEDKVKLLKAKFDLRRAELEVSKNELVSEIDARKNLLNLEEAKRRLAQLEQDINSRTASNSAAMALLQEKSRTAQLGMQQAQHSIDSMKLTSPINGVVAIKDNMDSGMVFYGMALPEYREGDLVNSGRFLAEVMDMEQMEVVAKIYESDRSNLNVGQMANVRIDAQPRVIFSAKVKNIAGMASRNDWGPNAIGRFDVSFAVAGRAAEIRPGSSAQIVVKGNQVKPFLPAVGCQYLIAPKRMVKHSAE